MLGSAFLDSVPLEVLLVKFYGSSCQWVATNLFLIFSNSSLAQYFCRGADKSLARPSSRCILFDGENISFDARLVICINSTNISPIMIVNRICETQNLLSL